MSQVFISYRQTDDAQRQRVRTFAERLRDFGINVILDQFLLDTDAGGPSEGWDKWSSDRAVNTEYILIVGTSDWFECFDKTQPRGTGLGAACEADDIRDRIYEAGGVVENIRVVLFDDADAAHIPAKLRRYHRFHAERDLANIVRWINGSIESGETPPTSIPHNLPSLQPFFGREDELKKIADALDPESRTWGALIDGPGGMGKTSLAVRAAYDASPDAFDRIVFVSLKSRELDDEGIRDMSGFLISGLAELLNELARELGHADIAKSPEDQRPRLLLEALRDTRTLLVLDNLESLLKLERDVVFTFVKRLPPRCKAILTSRGRIGSAAEELILEKLSKSASIATLATLAERNPALARSGESERLNLYHETGGNPLLLRWTAGQIGRGSCITISDAIAYLRSCPEGNNALEFVFGDLVEDFIEAETRVLCALTYFSLPAKVEHIAELTECSVTNADRVLRSLVNRSLVVPSEELKTFSLVPLVADFLRKKRPTVVQETGDRLEKQAFALVVENGYEKYDRFPVLESAWPTIAAALPCFLAGPSARLQTICDALFQPCNYSGRYDESLALNKDAEIRALSVKDFLNAGWRAYETGWIHYLRGQPTEVVASADRAQAHWDKAQPDTHKKATVANLRGIGHRLVGDYGSAIAFHREAIELWRTMTGQEKSIASALNHIAIAQRISGDFLAAESHYNQALEIARASDHQEAISYITGNLANLALCRQDWTGAELLAREALALSEKVGRQELIAADCQRLARALVRQGEKAKAITYAQRAVQIFSRLGSTEAAVAREILAECES